MSENSVGKGRKSHTPRNKRRVSDRLNEIEEIARETRSHCRTWQRLKNFTSLGIGGPIAAIIYPDSLAGAARLVSRLEQVGMRYRVLGCGAKAPASESRQDYVAVSLRLLDERLIFDGDRVYVHAGYSLPTLVDAAADRGLSGLESLAGIIGCVGGVLRLNGGLPGCMMWRLVEEIVIAQGGGLRTIPEPGEILEIALACMTDRDLILAVTLKLAPGDREKIKAQTRLIYLMRATDTPEINGAASRIFKDTAQGIARNIISQLGLGGISRGDTHISERHADFIIKGGKAIGGDVIDLTDLNRKRSRGEQVPELECEVNVWRDEPYRDPDEM